MLLNKLWFRNLVIFLALVLLLSLLISLQKIVAPLSIALAIGYVGDPIIDKLEEWKISRTWGIVILIFILILTMFGLTLYIVPKVLAQIQELLQKFPAYWETFRDKLLPQLTTYAQEHKEQVENLKEAALTWLQDNAGVLLTNITTNLASSFKSVGAFVANILSLIIIPVLAFYFLRDFDIMKGKVVKLIPLKRQKYIVDLFTELDLALGNFIKGQLLVALILAVIYSIGLTIAGCPASLLIGIVAGFANLIPYLGIALGFVPAVLLTYLTGNPMWQIILSGVTFIVGQMLEGMVITPKIVGESVGLHPVVVLIALMVGGGYFGFIGMILALPASAVLLVLFKRGYHYYIGSVLYHEGVLPSPPGNGEAPAMVPEEEEAPHDTET